MQRGPRCPCRTYLRGPRCALPTLRPIKARPDREVSCSLYIGCATSGCPCYRAKRRFVLFPCSFYLFPSLGGWPKSGLYNQHGILYTDCRAWMHLAQVRRVTIDVCCSLTIWKNTLAARTVCHCSPRVSSAVPSGNPRTFVPTPLKRGDKPRGSLTAYCLLVLLGSNPNQCTE